MLIAFRAVECTDGEEISLSKLSVSHVGQVGVISLGQAIQNWFHKIYRGIRKLASSVPCCRVFWIIGHPLQGAKYQRGDSATIILIV